MNKKIFFFIPSFTSGGAEKIYINLANEFIKKYDVSIVSFNLNGPLISLVSKKIKIINLEVSRVRYSFIKIIRLIKYQKPDIIFSPHRHCNIVISLSSIFFSKKIKLIFREANSLYEIENEKNFYKKFFFINYLKFNYKRCNKLVVVTNEIKFQLIKLNILREEDIILIPNPTIPDNFIDESFAKVHDEFVNKNKENLLINIGRLHPQKNHKALIDIFKIINNTNPKSKLLIIGEGNEKKTLNNLIELYNLNSHVKIISYQKNIFKYLINSKIMTVTSLYEGIGNVIIEAISLGVPVIALNNLDNDLSNLIIKNNGIIIKNNDLKNYANTVIKMLKKKIIININEKKNVIDRYSVKKNIKLYEKFL